ncbi:inositol monophosphatase family protein [Methylobacterium sp. NEAU 140]|uniref:inositol monophosphatase family protein n=1 Tax=Methylobacterium sp. NEAU 140 TaxID=3064945 RepID=UPI002734AEB7|nr:inositol monophosphatase family protein [Methylobacterium sp. NEAU 140]MDP4026036.1 inositol monophosphatase family protein [Methylobacterium sp. NEAU 140]
MIAPDAPAGDVLAAMLAFAEEAGRIALDLRAGGLAVAHKGPDLGQALTEADLAISRLLHARFGPDLIEEETAGSLSRAGAAALLARDAWTFVADPIDGTKSYAGGLPGWGTMLAACRSGRAVASVMSLPGWHENRTALPRRQGAEESSGLLLAARDGRAFWAPTRGGRRTRALEPLPVPEGGTGHVGWLAVAAQRYTLDYTRGLFPWGEGGAIADAALLATGRLDATLSNHKLWDAAPVLPVLAALGFSLFRWPDLGPPPAALIDLFDAEFSAHDALWLVCRDRAQAAALAGAIRRVPARDR